MIRSDPEVSDSALLLISENADRLKRDIAYSLKSEKG